MNTSVPPWFNAILSALRGLCIAIGALLVYMNYGDGSINKTLTMVAGATLVVGPMIWGIWIAGVQFYRAVAAGVQAGIAMTAQGKAITTTGDFISQFAGDGDATPPKPVTVESAKRIIADFGPDPRTIKTKEIS